MATISDKKTSMSVLQSLDAMKKEFGQTIGSFGGKAMETERIPTGMFEFDLATGGGFPKGKISLVYGPESSNKTNLVLLAIAQHQRLWPHQTCVFVDVENSYNREWAMMLGVDVDKLLVVNPSYAEQSIDVVVDLIAATDIGIIAYDSIAALSAAQEINNSADTALVGTVGLLGNKLFRQVVHALGEAQKADAEPTFIAVNQIRNKVGIVYGNPETKPGGKGQDFASYMIVRVHGENIMDTKVSKVMPVRKGTKFIIKKWKCPILAIEGKFEMVTIPHKGLKVGQCDDVDTVSTYLKEFGQYVKDKKGWLILDNVYKTQAEFEERFYQDQAFGDEIRTAVIAKIMSDKAAMESGDGVDV